jgi:hypothetical protein
MGQAAVAQYFFDVRYPETPEARNRIMKLHEIVAATIDRSKITTDPAAIDTARTLGLEVQFISRAQAKRVALLERSRQWLDLAIGRTLFLSDGNAFYRHEPSLWGVRN